LKKNSIQETAQSYSLADALFTSTQQRIFALLYGQPDRSFYLTEIVRLAEIGRGGVQRELRRLEQTGLVTTKNIGNQKHYQANPDTPVYQELTSIVRKTVGLKQPLMEALDSVKEKISLAFVYGSVAKGTDTASSDIDLMIVTDLLALEDVFTLLARVEEKLGRRVNPTLYNTPEFSKKRSSKNSFLVEVLSSPIIELIGFLDE
jgi:predicted nucleotidyltransferase